MPYRPPTRETCLVAEEHLRAAILPLRPDIPAAAIAVVADDEGLWSAQIFGVEQALQGPGDALYQEVLDRFAHWHPTYDDEEIAALLATFKLIAPKAGIAIRPDSLGLTELPEGVLVLTLNNVPVVASEDPLHLLSQGVLQLRSGQSAAH